jgi:phage gp29-like protein
MADDAHQLLGPDGQPIRKPVSKKDLAEIVARPSLAGVRQAWNGTTIASGLTPERLAALLRAAADGDAHDYLTLAEEMEERDWHYACELSKRKLAILGLDRIVSAAGEDPRDEEIAAAVREEIVNDEAFEDLLVGSTDGLGKGWAAVEIAWSTAGMWKPSGYEWKDPRWFRWDRETGKQLRLLSDENMVEGDELPPFRFAVHRPQLKMGLPIRGGLARLAAWAFLFKFYDVKDWAAFAESYGQPLRLGKYDKSATPDDVDILYRAVAMIGTDCAAVIPKAMEIEFIKADGAGKGSGADLYKEFAVFLDRQVSKAVLGQTGTADMQAGGGYAQAKVHDGVRDDLREADARALARTIRRDIFEPFVRFNFGPDAKVPLFKLETPETEDLDQFSKAIAPLIDRGLKVRASEIRSKFNLATPADDDEVLFPAKAAAAPADPALEHAPDRALNRLHAGCTCAACRAGRARNRAADRDAIDELADQALDGWQEELAPLIEPFERLAASATSYAEFEAGLVDAAGRMDPAALARGLGAALFKARGLGDLSDDPDA